MSKRPKDYPIALVRRNDAKIGVSESTFYVAPRRVPCRGRSLTRKELVTLALAGDRIAIDALRLDAIGLRYKAKGEYLWMADNRLCPWMGCIEIGPHWHRLPFRHDSRQDVLAFFLDEWKKTSEGHDGIP